MCVCVCVEIRLDPWKRRHTLRSRDNQMYRCAVDPQKLSTLEHARPPITQNSFVGGCIESGGGG